MDNWLITSRTIAILKNNKNTIIIDVDNIKVINKNINMILNSNCLFYGSSLDGRKKSAKRLLRISYKVPIIINKNIILLQINNPRSSQCLYIVLNKIINYSIYKEYLIINCVNNIVFRNRISKYKFERLILNGFILNNHLIIKKEDNFV